jgi:hypothetical protein
MELKDVLALALRLIHAFQTQNPFNGIESSHHHQSSKDG